MACKYGMIIDLTRCIGCDACTIACRQAKGTSRGLFHCRIIKYEVGTYPLSKLAFLPLLCMHCAEPPCVEVCPTGATVKREDGVVTIEPNLCIGCRKCVIACPYGARDSFRVGRTYYQDQKTTFEVFHEPTHKPDRVEKCDLCIDRLEKGMEPACVAACPAEARIVGDLEDDSGRIKKLIEERKGDVLKPELGTEPSVYYI